MFLIRRKVDGKFFKNKTRPDYDKAENNWSEKMSECNPFKTTAGAKTSRGWAGTKTILTDKACSECLSSNTPRYRYDCWNRCWKRIPMTPEECPFEIVKVFLTLQCDG